MIPLTHTTYNTWHYRLETIFLDASEFQPAMILSRYLFTVMGLLLLRSNNCEGM